MFQTLSSPKSKSTYSILGSLLLEATVVFVCVYHAPIFVKPASVAWGQRGISEDLVYGAPAQAQLRPRPKKTQPQLKTKPKPEPEVAKNEVEPARAGTPIGSLYHGPGSGSEAKPA